MTTVVESIDGRFQNEHYASFYVSQAAGASWVEVRFTDSNGDEFIAREFHLETADANAVEISFDPRNVATAVRVVHGVVQGDDTLDLPRKSAASIWVKQSVGAGTLRIFAWR